MATLSQTLNESLFVISASLRCSMSAGCRNELLRRILFPFTSDFGLSPSLNEELRAVLGLPSHLEVKELLRAMYLDLNELCRTTSTITLNFFLRRISKGHAQLKSDVLVVFQTESIDVSWQLKKIYFDIFIIRRFTQKFKL